RARLARRPARGVDRAERLTGATAAAAETLDGLRQVDPGLAELVLARVGGAARLQRVVRRAGRHPDPALGVARRERHGRAPRAARPRRERQRRGAALELVADQQVAVRPLDEPVAVRAGREPW